MEKVCQLFLVDWNFHPPKNWGRWSQFASFFRLKTTTPFPMYTLTVEWSGITPQRNINVYKCKYIYIYMHIQMDVKPSNSRLKKSRKSGSGTKIIELRSSVSGARKKFCCWACSSWRKFLRASTTLLKIFDQQDLCVWISYPRLPVTPCWRYLDLKNTPKTPNLRRYLEDYVTNSTPPNFCRAFWDERREKAFQILNERKHVIHPTSLSFFGELSHQAWP